jgi:hypothetical protein
LLVVYGLNKQTTLTMAAELADRRRSAAPPAPVEATVTLQ